MAFGMKHRQGEPRPRSTSGCSEAAEHPAARRHYLDRVPEALSGGQRQRVAIGRAIVPQSAGLPVRRAAVEPRCGAARRHAHRDRQAAAKHARHDDDLRHPRPGRGDDARRPHRGAEGRADRAGRHADGALPPPGNLFVARFIGSPAMNTVPCVDREYAVRRRRSAAVGGTSVKVRYRHSRRAPRARTAPSACGRGSVARRRARTTSSTATCRSSRSSAR